MKQYLLILALAAFWGLGGLMVSVGLNAIFDVNWAIPCTSLNVIAGMVMLLIATRNPRARRIFYEGPQNDEAGIVFLAFLWTFPISLVFLGILWWLLGQFFH
jgi:hypothetical protein